MGIFKALSASLQGVAHNQYKKFFYCDSMPNDVLMVKASKKSVNSSADDEAENIIPDGSVVAVNEGQCAIFVSSGKVMEVCAEPGSHEISNPEATGIFSGGKLKNAVKEVGRRFSFGGDAPAIDHRIYFVNTKIIMSNRVNVEHAALRGFNIGGICSTYGTRLVSHGIYSYRIVNPEIAYRMLIGDALRTFTVRYFNTAIADALSRHIKYTMYGAQNSSYKPTPDSPEADIDEYLLENFGIQINSLDFVDYGLSNADGVFIDNQRSRSFSRSANTDSSDGNGTLNDSNIKDYNDNDIGVNSNMQESTDNAVRTSSNMQESTDNTVRASSNIQVNTENTVRASSNIQEDPDNSGTVNSGHQEKINNSSFSFAKWICKCGNTNTSKFCTECGKWKCGCGSVAEGNFCGECGSHR